MTAEAAISSTSKAPRRVFPIYVKVLMLFFLNVLIVAGGAFWALRQVFELDRELLVDRNARERLQLLGETVVKQTKSTSWLNWDRILNEHSEVNHAQLSLFRNNGEWLSGAKHELPEAVRDLLRGPQQGQGNGPPPRDQQWEGRPPRDEFDFLDPESPPRRPNPNPNPNPNGDTPSAKGAYKVEAVDAAGAYWFVVRLPPIPEAGPPNRPPSLVGRVASLGESNLLFNPKPWFFAGLGVLFVSALVWLPLVRSLTKTLSQMTHATAKIAQGQFDVRVSESRRDELGHLGSAINAMSERLAGFVTGQKRFLGDIAHELCSPVVRMEMALGILEQKVPEELLPRLADVREEVREMSELVSELLSFSKAGLTGVPQQQENVTLLDIVRGAISREAAKSDVRIELPESLRVQAAPAMLGRAIGNILRNAVRYAGDCGPIEITADQEDDAVQLTIADHGPGVPEEDLPKLFDPFFRCDLSRTRETGGTGLGLAIVKSCIDTCGGTVAVANHPDGGFIVTLTMRIASN